MSDSPYHQAPWQGTYFLQFNIERSPANDLQVRKALALAIDRDKLVATVLKGTELANASLVPAGTPGYTSPEVPGYDPKQARALLSAAGYPDGHGWPDIQFLFNNGEENRKIATALQQMWKDELNITISLTSQEWKVYLDTIREKNFTLSRRGWIAGSLDPAEFLQLFTSDGGNNNTGFSNPRYDALVLKLSPRAAEPDVRSGLLEEAEAILLQAVPIIPLYTYNSKHLIQPGVMGVPGNVLDLLNYKYISLDPTTPVWKDGS
jgi:oligopeptide transport system substrate-binding protein